MKHGRKLHFEFVYNDVTSTRVVRVIWSEHHVRSVLEKAIEGSRVLVVGTGGIGCELLKNLVLTGFRDIVAVIISHADRPIVGL